jgi:hypothetical protein
MLLLITVLSLLAVVVLGVFVAEPMFDEPYREVADAASSSAGSAGLRIARPG